MYLLGLMCFVVFDLYSDDELTPYDMSGDQEISKASPPRYLRDCLESMAPQITSLWPHLLFECCGTSSSSNIVLSVDPFSFNFLWGLGARGAQFESRKGFGEEERLRSQRGTAAREILVIAKRILVHHFSHNGSCLFVFSDQCPAGQSAPSHGG